MACDCGNCVLPRRWGYGHYFRISRQGVGDYPMSEIRLTDNERTALSAWKDVYFDCSVLNFDLVSRKSGLPRNLVRRTVRSLARKGITEFAQTCWTEDGEIAGAGYMLTKQGREIMRQYINEQPLIG